MLSRINPTPSNSFAGLTVVLCNLFLRGIHAPKNHPGLSALGFSGRGHALFLAGSHDLSQQILFRYCPDHGAGSFINRRLRNAAHPISIGQFREFHRLHPFCANQGRILHGHTVCEQHGPRAIGSGGGDKDL